jgi:hypothetical protein
MTTRIVITEDEKWPVYGIIPADPETPTRYPTAGLEVDQALIDEYNRAKDAWDAVQAKLGDLLSARERQP